MSDAYPLPKNIPQGPQPQDQPDTSLPPASGVVQQMPDLAKRVANVANSPNYKALQPEQETSFGPAGLVGQAARLGAIPGVQGLAAGLGGMAAGAAGAAAPLAAAAYGIGKLVAPKWTDQTVGKIKDWLSSQVAPELNRQQAIGSAYLTGMGESVPGSKFLEKKLPELGSYLDTIKNQHPDAAKEGQIAGTVGQFAIPGISAFQGATVPGRIAAAAGNAALTAAPFALGHGLDVGATTGDVGQGMKAGLTTEALGTGSGAALGGIAEVPAVQRFLTKIQLAGAGLRTSDAAKNLRQYATHSLGLRGPAVDAYVASHATPLEEKLGGLVDQFGQGRAAKEAMRDWNDSGFDAHGSIYEAVTGNHVTTGIGGQAGMSDADHVLQDPDLMENAALWHDNPQTVADAVQTMGKKIDGLPWQQARNKVLLPYINAGNDSRLAADSPQKLQAYVAQAWRNQIDGIADRSMAWAKEGALGPDAQQAAQNVPDLLTLKSTYPAIQSIKRAQGREEPMIPTNFANGSDTFARLATDAILQGGGTALGGIAGGPAGAAAAHLLGPVVARAGGKIAEKGVGALAGLAKKAIAGSQELPGGLVGKASALGLPDMLNGPTMPVGTTIEGTPPEQQPTMPAGAQPIPNAPVPGPAPGPQQATGVPPGAAPIPNAAPISPQDQAQADFASAGQTPAGQTGQWNAAFVENRIRTKWQRYQRQYGAIPYDQYKQAAMDATQGLDPKLPSTWQAMFDDKETGTRLYNSYMGLQKIADVDPGRALNHYTRLFQLGNRLAPEEQQRETEDNARLVQALSDMTKLPVKEVDNRLRQIAWSKGRTPEQKKQAVLDMIVKEGGVDVPLLVKMGLW